MLRHEFAVVARPLTLAEACQRLDLSATALRSYLTAGRIPGAYRHGRDWLIPADCVKPEARKPGRRPKLSAP